MGSNLFEPFDLPCGARLKNRILKSAMSDSLGDGTGHPSDDQIRLYQRWADGGVAASIIGEVQGSPHYAERPGNLVLTAPADLGRFRALALAGRAQGSQLWVQLGHAGALAYAPISTPRGPSALNVPGLRAAELTLEEIASVPTSFAATARLALDCGFGGVEIHAAHGFLLSQFLSPLFNQRTDAYGGSIEKRAMLLLETIDAVRSAVGTGTPIAVKLNSSDMLEGGLSEEEALKVVALLERTSIDVIDISGGTYFPGAKAASDAAGAGPYFRRFARQARAVTGKPLMLTGGIKTRAQADDAVSDGTADLIGLARALVLEPRLPTLWRDDMVPEPRFPRFANATEGGVTAWYTMRLTQLGQDRETADVGDLKTAIDAYDTRDRDRAAVWRAYFGH
ncbi:MAG: oxidoreductase [Pseudomonadota bacterium]